MRKVEVFPVLSDEQITAPLHISCSKDAKVARVFLYSTHYLLFLSAGQRYSGACVLAVHT